MATLQQIARHMTFPRTSIALGNFDGVHLGHQKILDELKLSAKKYSAEPVVLILFPHPREVFSGNSPALLSTLEDRIKIIQSFGVNHVFHLTFDFELSKHTAFSFLQIFQKDFHMTSLIMGANSHIGKNREGTPEKVLMIAQELGFTLSKVDPLHTKQGVVSSSLIRDYVSKGDVAAAGKMLGRFYSNKGQVTTGMGKGRGMGYPTANLGEIETLVPASGVYAGYCWVNGQKYKSAINIGTRPTITDSPDLVVEPHLLDFDGQIVGKNIEIQWVERLRDEIKFETVEKLKAQIHEDVRKTNSIL